MLLLLSLFYHFGEKIYIDSSKKPRKIVGFGVYQTPITNYLKEKKLHPYWASTSSNGLVSKLIRCASGNLKENIEDLINQKGITVNFDEQIIFNQLDQEENAIWS